MDFEAVRGAVRGADVVISVLGHIQGSDPRMQTKGIANIVRAMSEAGVKRIVSLTGTGVRAHGDRPSMLDRVLNAVVGIIDPDRIRDGIEHVQVLRDSHLDWTVVRVLKLFNGSSGTNTYVLTDGGPAEFRTSRAKVARVLVDVVDNAAYIGKLPVITM